MRAGLLELVVQTTSSDRAEQLRQQIRGLDLVTDSNFEFGALQVAGQRIDNPEGMQHNMAPDGMAYDSAERRLLQQRKEH